MSVNNGARKLVSLLYTSPNPEDVLKITTDSRFGTGSKFATAVANSTKSAEKCLLS